MSKTSEAARQAQERRCGGAWPCPGSGLRTVPRLTLADESAPPPYPETVEAELTLTRCDGGWTYEWHAPHGQVVCCGWSAGDSNEARTEAETHLAVSAWIVHGKARETQARAAADEAAFQHFDHSPKLIRYRFIEACNIWHETYIRVLKGDTE